MVMLVLLCLFGAAGIAMLFMPPFRNAALFAVSGSILAYFSWWDPGTVPEVRYVAILFWLAAIVIAAAHMRTGRSSRRIA